ncbi:RNA polymerase sigma factor RpoS [Alishewanella longhuensis]
MLSKNSISIYAQPVSYHKSSITNPAQKEIAAALDKPVAEVRKMLKLNEKITSVDTPVAGSSEKQLLDVIADEKELGPEMELQDADIRQHLVIWLYQQFYNGTLEVMGSGDQID